MARDVETRRKSRANSALSKALRHSMDGALSIAYHANVRRLDVRFERAPLDPRFSRPGRSRGVTLCIGAILAATLVFVGCSSSSSKPAVCGDITNFKSSLTALQNVNVTQNGLSSLKTAVTNVQKSASALEKSAQSQYGADAKSLESSVNQLVSTVQSLSPSNLSGSVTTVKNDVAQVSTSFQKLQSDFKNTCK